MLLSYSMRSLGEQNDNDGDTCFFTFPQILIVCTKKVFRGWSAGGVFSSGRFALASSPFEIGEASLEFRDTLRLQEKDLTFKIGEARSLRGLDLFEIFEGLEAGEEFFDIRRTCIGEGFDTRDGNGELCTVFGGFEFAAEGPVADGAFTDVQ